MTTTKTTTSANGETVTTTETTSGGGGGDGGSFAVQRTASGSAVSANQFGVEKFAGIKHDTSEMRGPVLPVDRAHNFPKDIPKREEAPEKDKLKFPVLGVEKSHSFVVSFAATIIIIIWY